MQIKCVNTKNKCYYQKNQAKEAVTNILINY